MGWTGGPAQSPRVEFALYAAAHLLLYFLVFSRRSLLRRYGLAEGGGGRVSLVILAVGIVLRLAFLPYPASDDVNRYAWSGVMQNRPDTVFNPYLHAPSSYAKEFAADPVFRGINHKDLPGAYPPLAQIVFRGVAAAASRLQVEPARAFKLLFVLIEIATMLLLTALLRAWQRPPHWLAIYAWSPLVLLYGVGEGHLDVLQTALVAGSLYCFYRRRPIPVAGYLLLGAGVMSKFLPVILLPFVCRRRNLRWLPVFFLPFLLYLPYYEPGIFGSLMTFSGDMHYNDLVPQALRLLFDGPAYSLAMPAMYAAGLAAIWLAKQDGPLPAMAYAWMWLILCLPTVHPWYLMTPFLLLAAWPSRAWLVLGATMGFQFWVRHHSHMQQEWRELPWVWLATYLPFLAILVYDVLRPSRRQCPDQSPAGSLDIVIPTLNEGESLPATLDSIAVAVERLQAAGSFPVEVFVVDAGSTDGTPEVAAERGAAVLAAQAAGRGDQMAQGAEAGSGDLVLMLHADAVMQPEALAKLVGELRRSAAIAWGVLGHAYDRRSLKMRLVELSNRLRVLLGGIAFGDQGIFVRRDCLRQIGGVPAIPLMEDVELSLRLARFPAPLNLGSSLTVSTRRWQRKKFSGYTVQVLRLVSTYLVRRRLGADVRALAERMCQTYYGKARN